LLGTLGFTLVYFFANNFGNGSISSGFIILSLIISIVFICTTIITIVNVKEKPTNIGEGIELKFKDIGRILLTNKELFSYIIILVTLFLSILIIKNILIYYIIY